MTCSRVLENVHKNMLKGPTVMPLRTKPVAKRTAVMESLINELEFESVPDQTAERAHVNEARVHNAIEIARALIDSHGPITTLSEKHGALRIKLTKVGSALLTHSANLLAYATPTERFSFCLHPSVENLIRELNKSRAIFQLRPEILDAMMRSDPKVLHDTITGFVDSFRRNAGTSRNRLVAYEHQRCHDDHFKAVFNALKKQAMRFPGARVVQVDLLGPAIEKIATQPPLEQEVLNLTNAYQRWQTSMHERLGKDRLLEAHQLMVSSRGARIHCALLVNQHSLAEVKDLVKFLDDCWLESFPEAEFYNPNFPGSPFEFRGMDPDIAEGYPLLARLENVATYLVRPIQMLSCHPIAGVQFSGLQSRDIDLKPKLGHKQPRTASYSELMAKATLPQPKLMRIDDFSAEGHRQGRLAAN